jgi:hypothetical protein
MKGQSCGESSPGTDGIEFCGRLWTSRMASAYWTKPCEAAIHSERTTASCSDFGQKQSILDIHTEMPNSVLDLGVAEQDLDRAQVTGGLVNHSRLRSSKGMRSVV